VSAGKTTFRHLRKLAGSNVLAAETDCKTAFVHTKPNASTAVESYCKRKPNAENDLETFVRSHLDT
jgi:hypothetical protein